MCFFTKLGQSAFRDFVFGVGIANYIEGVFHCLRGGFQFDILLFLLFLGHFKIL